MFSRSNIYKYLIFTFILSTISGTIIYSLLNNRHKAIVKTHFFHITGLLNNSWAEINNKNTLKIHSPTFLIDGIYKSMEGPKASRYVQLSPDKKLLWITGFEVKALDDKTNQIISNDFICHLNVDINDQSYYSNFGLEDRIQKQYPRLTSLSHGLEKYYFPKGYAIPIYGNDLLFVTTQTLNHNFKKIHKTVKHEVKIKYSEDTNNLKPLFNRTAYIQLPFNEFNINKQPLDPRSNECIPVETKNSVYINSCGKKFSGHWKIPIGKKTYSSSINSLLLLTKPERLHLAIPHVHPFATSIGIFDKTTNKMLFNCKVENHKKSIGIKKIETFSTESGIWFYPNHEYEMILNSNNTSNEIQDMMGSMFLYFYDDELENKLKHQ